MINLGAYLLLLTFELWKLWCYKMVCTGISHESAHFHMKNTENRKFVYNPKGALGMKTNENGQENLFPFLFLFFGANEIIFEKLGLKTRSGLEKLRSKTRSRYPGIQKWLNVLRVKKKKLS